MSFHSILRRFFPARDAAGNSVVAQAKHHSVISARIIRKDGTVEELGEIARTPVSKRQIKKIKKEIAQ